jgi:cation diffusion facilitator CzcD-associated flavoprotein CzcO
LTPTIDAGSPAHTDTRVVIVGAGIGGLGIARAMKLAGIPFTVLEKAPQVGGTWWHNRYPGLKCDVPVIAYRYGFESITGNSRSLLPTRAELWARAERLCDDNELRPFIRFNSEVVKATWTGTRWVITLADGDVVEGEVVVWCTGFLHHPHIPEITGMSSFVGPVVHAAQWDADLDVTGKRVAVIGSGSTGCQLVPGLAGNAARTVVFARNPQWILPVPDLAMPKWFTWLLTRFPKIDKKVRSITLTAIMKLLGEGSSTRVSAKSHFSWSVVV